MYEQILSLRAAKLFCFKELALAVSDQISTSSTISRTQKEILSCIQYAQLSAPRSPELDWSLQVQQWNEYVPD